MSAPFDPPADFVRQLNDQFAGRLRLRWSDSAKQWHIEQKVGRQKAPHRKVSNLDDRAIRWRDGYEFLLAVTPGSSTSCPNCGMWTKVPVLEMRYAKCQVCGKEFRACYWPLGDHLLQWLRYGDPDRGGLERMMRDLENEEYSKEFWKTRAQRSYRRDVIWDDWRHLFDVPQVGYTGKEFRG